jgi:succinoglycan biosynthesis protein ExoM
MGMESAAGCVAEAQAARATRYTIAIPTVRGPRQLRSVIDSVRRQDGVDLALAEILIVDNSAKGDANWVVEQYAEGTPTLRYVHETMAGPSHARNRAVTDARGQILVFLDDDETADSSWLAALIEALERSSADAAFGQVVACFEAMPERHVMLADRIFSRRLDAKPHADITRLHARLGTGNSAFRTSCFAGRAPFASKVATSGGEDVILLRDLVKSRHRFVWVPSAIVLEHVACERLTAKALRARRFRQGQLRALVCLGKPFNPLSAMVWMGVGLVQAIGASLAWIFVAPAFRREARERAAIDLAGGLGKLFWWFASPTRYGALGEADPAPPPTDRSYAFSRS